MRKNIRWSVDLRLLYIAYVFMYGLIVKFTISNSLLFKAKTYIPEVLLLFIALLGVKSNAWKMKRCFVLLLTFSALVVTVNIARHGLTEQGVYAIRDIYIPLTAFSCMMIPFTDNENEIYTKRLVKFFKFYLIAGLILAAVEQVKGWQWTSVFYTGHEFYGQDPLSKIKVAHSFGLLRAPSLSGNFATFGYYIIIAGITINAYEKIPRKQMFWDVIAIVCMVLSTNKSAIVIYTVILVFRWIVDLHHQTIHKNNLAVLGIICFLCILALCFWLSRSETKGVFLSLYERVYYWTENLSEVSFAELILPYNQFAYGSGAEGGLSFWDNTYLYGLFTQGIVGMILWFNALKECYTLRKKNGDFSAHNQIFELTVALAVLSLTANVTQGRGFLTPYIVLVSTGWTYIKAEN